MGKSNGKGSNLIWIGGVTLFSVIAGLIVHENNKDTKKLEELNRQLAENSRERDRQLAELVKIMEDTENNLNEAKEHNKKTEEMLKEFDSLEENKSNNYEFKPMFENFEDFDRKMRDKDYVFKFKWLIQKWIV